MCCPGGGGGARKSPKHRPPKPAPAPKTAAEVAAAAAVAAAEAAAAGKVAERAEREVAKRRQRAERFNLGEGEQLSGAGAPSAGEEGRRAPPAVESESDGQQRAAARGGAKMQPAAQAAGHGVREGQRSLRTEWRCSAELGCACAATCGLWAPTTWTILQQDGPGHLGL